MMIAANRRASTVAQMLCTGNPGVGRTHARTHVLMLTQDLHIRIINAATGELIRELTLDTSRNYQPQKPKTPPAND
jgi:Holliday junction resolvasome RuvABC ATP-dependent DNA helicase subunit